MKTQLSGFFVVGMMWGVCAEATIDWGAGTAATVSGGTVTLTTAEERTKLAALEALTIDAGAALELAFGSDNAVTIKANISGAGNFCAHDSKFTLTGDSRAHTGNMAFTNSWVYVTSRYGLGYGVAQGLTNRYVASVIPAISGKHTYNGTLRFSGEGCTVDANLAIGGYRDKEPQYLTADADTLTLNGWLTMVNSFTAISFGNTVANGTFYHSSKPTGFPSKTTWYHSIRKGRTVTVNAPIDASWSSYFYWNVVGTESVLKLTAGSRGNFVKGGRLVGMGRILCSGEDVLWGNDAIDMVDNNVTIPLTLDLNGYDQWCSYINQGRWDTPHKGSGLKVSSTTPATLTMTNTTFALGGKISGGVIIGFAGKAGFHYAGTGGYVISNGVSETEGELRVSKGKLAFVAGAGWQGPKVGVEGTGVLSIGKDFSFMKDGTTRLAVSDQGRIEFAVPTQLSVDSFTTNGVALPNNRVYTSADLPEVISGEGSIKVVRVITEVVTRTWTGAGADDQILSADNWEGGTTPDLDAGNAKIVVPATAAQRTLRLPAGESLISGLEVQGAGITVCGADATSKLFVNREALRVTGSGSGVTVTNVFDVPIDVQFPQTKAWYFGAGTRTEFRQPLTGGLENDVLAFGGALGEVALKGDNADLRAKLYSTNVLFYCWTPTAMGGTNRYTYVTYAAKDGVTAAQLGSGMARIQFQGMTPTNATPLAIGNTSMWSGGLCFRENATYPIVFTAPFAAYFQVPNVSLTGEWTFLGGLEFQGGNFWNYGSASSRVYVKEKPIKQDAGTYFLTGGSEWHVYTTGNSYNFLYPNGRWICEVEDSLTSSAGAGWLTFGINSSDVAGYVDLNGFDQHVARLCQRGRVAGENDDHALNEAGGEVLPNGKYGIITNSSAQAATFFLQPRVNDSFCNQVRLTGNISLTACGIGTNAFQRARWNTTGALSVQSGTLAFIRGAGWDNAGEIAVSGGTLRIDAESAPTAFGATVGQSEATLNLSGEGVLQLGGDVTTVRLFLTNGRLRKCGYYGSLDCTDSRVPAQNKLASIQGAGLLRCLSGAGTAIILR